MTLRRIQPMKFPDDVKLDPGPMPDFAWVAPTDLWVDETYQRDLTQRSFGLISKIRGKFRYSKMKPIIAVREGEKLHAIDGQHTAIAAASAGLARVPVFIVEAEAMTDRAASFVAHNNDRLKVPPFAIYKAMLAAGDEGAKLCDTVVKRAGVRLRAISQLSDVQPGDCAALGIVQRLIKDHGPMRARVVLEALVKAECAPISSDEIKAATEVLWGKWRHDMEALAAVIRREPDGYLDRAKMTSKASRTQTWRVLSDRWGKVLDAQKAA